MFKSKINPYTPPGNIRDDQTAPRIGVMRTLGLAFMFGSAVFFTGLCIAGFEFSTTVTTTHDPPLSKGGGVVVWESSKTTYHAWPIWCLLVFVLGILLSNLANKKSYS